MKASKYLALAILTFFLITPENTQAQNWEKFFEKAADKYEDGDYEKAGKYIAKLKKKSLKKLGTKTNIYALGLVEEARINTALGVYTNVMEPLATAVQINEEINADKPIEYGYLLKEAGQVMIQYGNFNMAEEYVTKAREAFTEAGIIEEQEGELDVQDAKIMMGRGYYWEAIQLVDKQADFFKKQIARAGKREKDEPMKQWAEVMIVKANALRLMGDYLRSDSAFLYATNWIDDNLGKTDILYAQSKYLNAKLLQENGLELEALSALLEKSYIQATRRYEPSHMAIMEIKTDLMNVLYAVGTYGKLRIVDEEFKKTVRSLFPKNSVHTIAEDLRNVYFRLEDENIRVLEERINRLLANKVIPENHKIRIELLDFANDIALLSGEHKNTETYQKQILDIKKVLYGEESPEYHMSRIKLANYYVDYSDKFDEVADTYETSFMQIVDPEITEGHVMYLDILSHLATYYEETDQYDLAARTLDRMLLAARRKYDNEDIEYGRTLDKIARLQINIGEYEDADKNLKTAVQIFENLRSDVGNTQLSVALITQAELMGIRGEYDEAESLINRSERMQSRGALTLEATTLDYRDDLAELYIQIGRLSDAEEILNESLSEKTKDFGRTSRHLNQTLVTSAQLKLTKGEYTEAEQFSRRANDISLRIFGAESSKVVPSMVLLAKVYSTIGDFDKAQQLLSKAIEIQKNQFGNDHVDVGKTVSELALVKYYRNDPQIEVTRLFAEAERIIGDKLGKTNPTYAEILKNMAITNIAAGQYNLAFTQLDEAGRIWNNKIGRRNNLNAATIDYLKGDIYYRQKNYGQAEDLYGDAIRKYNRFFNDTHPEYVKVQSKLAKTYFMQGDWRRSQSEMEEVLENYKVFIQDYFPALSEREKAKFWNTIKTDYEFYNTLVINKNRNDRYIGELYNNALLTKALLLNTSIKIRERILSSSDEELKEAYNQWIAKKELLTAALSMSEEQLSQSGINRSQLSQEVELLEKDLSVKSELFGQSIDQETVTWENVRDAMQENEVAIEMVRFRIFDHTFTDSIKYALLYVTGEKRSQPGMILLDNGKDLESKYLNYYRNSIKYKIRDINSYEAYWSPIIRKLGTVSTLYISPDGVYNQINLEAIPTLEPNKYVIDNSNIVLLSNTKDLYLKQQKLEPAVEKQVAMMFGNPQFYVKTRPGQPTAESGLTRENVEVVQQLPGTEKEIQEVKDYLGRKGWEINDYTEQNAEESAIKQINSPRIFHVATHGFFQPDNIEASALDAELNENYLYENPLLKSGLLLTGAGDILNETKYNYNIENGILTAYEAMNLNLDQTDLVVLSACETGLGELQAGEGVYGLQRAFLVAGAKTIIMSLFKVSDEATQQLMVKFYRKWLDTGNKRQAFIDAKKEIRNEYRDPIYWGPFVMIGLN